MNYIYTGTLQHVDNLITQFKNAGQEIWGNGIGYPIATMTNDDVFVGLDWEFDGILEFGFGLVCNDEQMHIWLEKRNIDYKGYDPRQVKTRKEFAANAKSIMDVVYGEYDKSQLDSSISRQFDEKNRSWWSYTGDTDKVAHSFSARGVGKIFFVFIDK
jgi:hypothetical protein